jgi:sigma54-dependent transcription regulator
MTSRQGEAHGFDAVRVRTHLTRIVVSWAVVSR